MTCLAPLALIGVLLLILPIVVHLFKPRKMKQTPFSSLRWLKATHQRLSRRIQWHQWLLFLLRAGCILLLVLALAKPLFGLWGSQSVDRFVIVDVSRSMAYQRPDQPTPLDRATDLAGRYLQTARVGDKTSVILAGSSPRLLAPPSADASSALPALKALHAGQTDGSLSAALPLVRSLLPRSKDREVEIVILTDNLKGRWEEPQVRSFLQDLPNPVRVKVIETGAGTAPNAWIAGARLMQFGDDDDRWIRVELGCNTKSKERSVRRTGIAGLGPDTRPIELEPGQLARASFRIPASINLQGQVAELRLEPADALPSDDWWYLNLDSASSLRVLLIEPPALGTSGYRVGVNLRSAMEVLTASKNQALDVATRTTATVTVGDVQKADVVLLAGASELPDDVLENLEKRVRGGVGLGIFLGPQLKSAFVNQKLHRAQQPAAGLLPFSVNPATPLVEGRPGAFTNIRWTHPLLALMQDPVLSDFTKSRCHRFAKLDGTAGKNDTILARFDDDLPAIVDHPLGEGRVLLFNLSANDEWGNLPKHDCYVTLVERMLLHLSAGGVQKSFTVGAPVTLPLPEYQAGSEVKIVGPSDAKVPVRLIAQRGQTLLHLDEVAEAGVYRVEGAGPRPIVFVVNTPRGDSPMSAMDAKTLEEWWSPAALKVVSAETAGEELAQQSSHWPLWPLLVLFAGMLLVAETIYVHLLCPRANPKAADAVVPQRGVLKPVEEKSV